MLMNRRGVCLRVRVLILLLYHPAGVPSITPGARRASAAWFLLDLLPKAFGVSWYNPATQLGSPSYTFPVSHSDDFQAHHNGNSHSKHRVGS